MNDFNVINKTMDLTECIGKWGFSKEHNCYYLENVVYVPNSLAPKYQRLHIFVPAEYLNKDGSINEQGKSGKFTSKTAPIVFENCAAGYAQREPVFLGDGRCYADQYLKCGMIYISCGCRGRETQDEKGKYIGKSPATLIDIKTAIRFIKHNKNVLAGDVEKMVSVGCSAGGAMSSLIGVTGNNKEYDEMLKENGAFMNETDDVFAAQVYCPIIDLENADMAYEWLFKDDFVSEPSPFAKGGAMTEYEKAISGKLASSYIPYFNSLNLKHPETKEHLTLNEDGRSGSAYDYIMDIFNNSATKFLKKLENRELEISYSIDDYIKGNYEYEVVDKEKLMKNKAKKNEENKEQDDKKDEKGKKRGEFEGFGAVIRDEIPMKTVKGADKTNWLSWNGEDAKLTSLDDYLKYYRKRMKGCPSFDHLTNKSPENQVFGDEKTDFNHFSPALADAIYALKDEFPEEYEKYAKDFEDVKGDVELNKRCHLINPMNFIEDGNSDISKHFRINVGAYDVDTAYTISIALALKLMETGKTDVIYNLVWDQPHCEADYKGEVCDWIESICAK